MQLIETSPCPVPMDGAQQFAQDFKATQKLPGQIVESQHGQVLSLEVHQTSTSEDIPRPAQQKLNGIVTQAKRREKQKKKQRKKRRKRN